MEVAWAEAAAQKNASKPDSPAPMARRICTENSPKDQPASLKAATGQPATDVLRALESGNGWFETGRRCCAGKDSTHDHWYAVGKGVACMPACLHHQRCLRTDLTRRTGVAIRTSRGALRVFVGICRCRSSARMARTVCLRRGSRDETIGIGIGNQLLGRHPHHHCAARPHAQRQKSDHEDKDAAAHTVMIGQVPISSMQPGVTKRSGRRSIPTHAGA